MKRCLTAKYSSSLTCALLMLLLSSLYRILYVLLMPVLVFLCFNLYLVNMETFLNESLSVLGISEQEIYKLQIKPDLHPFPSQVYFHSDKFYSLVSREINMYILDIIRGGFRFTNIKSDP